MKPVALEFTVMRATTLKMLVASPDDMPLEEGHEELRFRVVIGGDCYYKQKNILDEDVWTRIGDQGPLMGTASRWMKFSRIPVMMLALRHLTIYLPDQVPTEERPNGSVVFDLGTV